MTGSGTHINTERHRRRRSHKRTEMEARSSVPSASPRLNPSIVTPPVVPPSQKHPCAVHLLALPPFVATPSLGPLCAGRCLSSGGFLDAVMPRCTSLSMCAHLVCTLFIKSCAVQHMHKHTLACTCVHTAYVRVLVHVCDSARLDEEGAYEVRACTRHQAQTLSMK